MTSKQRYAAAAARISRPALRSIAPLCLGLLLVTGCASATSPGSEAAEELEAALTVPQRGGTPPTVTEGVPHIQLDQTSSPGIVDELVSRTFSLDGVVDEPSRASLPGATALVVAPGRPARPEAMIVGREFAHIHPEPNGAGSLHLRLGAADAALLVEQGWGEYHPFAIDGTFPDLVMVYAPQSKDDLEVVMTIIEEAVAYATSTG